MLMRLMKPRRHNARAGSADRPLQLSAHRLAKVIRALNAERDEQSLARLSPRIRLRGSVMMLPLGRSTTADARFVGVYDISRAGVAIVDQLPVAIGTQFKMLIPRRLRRPIEVLCTVRHCRASDGAFIIGAEYGVSWLETLGALVRPGGLKSVVIEDDLICDAVA